MLQCAPVISTHIFLLILLLLCHTSSASREIITRMRIDRECKSRQSSDRALRVYIRLTFATCCSVLQCIAVRCSVCSVLQRVAVEYSVLQCVAVCCSALQCVAVCCSVLQRVAACCSLLQCVAVCCSTDALRARAQFPPIVEYSAVCWFEMCNVF